MEKFMTLLQEKLTPIANFCGTERHFSVCARRHDLGPAVLGCGLTGSCL